jgi:hypothetical protein
MVHHHYVLTETKADGMLHITQPFLLLINQEVRTMNQILYLSLGYWRGF